MAATRKTQNTEVLIIGADWAGLLLAEGYRQQGMQVEVFDTRPSWGRGGLVNADLQFLPSSPISQKLVTWAANLLHSQIIVQEEECGPVHFDEGQLRPFVGFGDRAFASRDEIDFYAKPAILLTQPNLIEMAELLSQSWKEQIHFGYPVTKFICEEGRIAAVEFNGEELWTAPKIVCTSGPTDLLEWIPMESMDGRSRTKLAKTQAWTALTLELHHPAPVSMERGMHVLYGSGQEFEPILGKFWPVEPAGTQRSLWMTLVSKDFSEDSDQLGQALKHLKRQVKRAYPDLFENLTDEVLVISPENHGAMSIKSPLSNLVIASPLQSQFRGALAGLDVASEILAPTENIPVVLANETTATEPDQAVTQTSI